MISLGFPFFIRELARERKTAYINPTAEKRFRFGKTAIRKL